MFVESQTLSSAHSRHSRELHYRQSEVAQKSMHVTHVPVNSFSKESESHSRHRSCL